MNWDDLRFLLAIYRQQTLSGAARDLGVNHTTVSRRLQALEERIGSRLFDRLPDGYRVTSAGGAVVEVAEDMERQIAILDGKLLGLDTRLEGPLRVTTLDVIAWGHADLLHGFAETYPEVDLHLTIDNQSLSLTKREADVAVRLTNQPPEHLVGRKVCRAEFALYGAKTLVMDGSDIRPLAELPWLGWHPRLEARLTEQWMRDHVPEAKVVTRLDASVVMLAMVAEGVGINFLPCFFGDADPRLVRLRPVEPGFGMDLWLLTHPALRTNARVRAFLDHMDHGLRSLADRYAGAREAPASALP